MSSASETLAQLWQKVPRWMHPWLVLMVAIGACAFLAAAKPSEGMLPRCPSRTILGVFCPGCGSQRTVHALLHGRFGAAWRINPLAVIAVPYLAVSWMLWTFRSHRVAVREIYIPSKVIWGLLFLIIAITIIRNVEPMNDALGLVHLDDYSAGSAAR